MRLLPVWRSRTTDRARRAVDADDVGVGVHLDIEPLAEHLGRRDQQRSLVSDDVADEVRQSAVREGHVGPAIEDDNLHRLIKAPQSRGTRRASGHAADDQDTADRRLAALGDNGAIALQQRDSGNLIDCFASQIVEEHPEGLGVLRTGESRRPIHVTHSLLSDAPGFLKNEIVRHVPVVDDCLDEQNQSPARRQLSRAL